MNTRQTEYTKLVVAIPHSAGTLSGQGASDAKTRAYRDRWTDWFTDELFAAESPRISVVKGDVSRLECDLERLEGEKDRLCNYMNIASRAFGDIGSQRNSLLAKWFRYRADILDAASDGFPLIIDCHSFPSDLAPEVDVCIGYNEDSSRPDQSTLEKIREVFVQSGYRVAFNTPYSNALAPIEYIGHSIMVEVNKRTYMDEVELRKSDRFLQLRQTILRMYEVLFR